jgi:hypothetical protein
LLAGKQARDDRARTDALPPAPSSSRSSPAG